LSIIQIRSKHLPQTGMYAFSNAAHKPFQSGNAWHNNITGNQPRTGLNDKGAWAVISSPACRIEPPRQSKATNVVIPEIGQPMCLSNGLNMSFIRARSKIPPKMDIRTQPKLVTQKRQNGIRNAVRIFWKNTKIKNTALQKSVAKTGVLATKPIDGKNISLLQMKIPGEVTGRRLSGISSKTAALLICQKSSGHGVRNSKVLRHVSAAQKTKDKSFAKHMCGTNGFSNKIRTLKEVAA
jgi:hypothetical protein